MAKVDWTNGSFITPTFMNSYVGIDADKGHNHQGLDATDSAPKIHSVNEILYDASSFDASVTTPYFDTPETQTLKYQKSGNFVTLWIPGFQGSATSDQRLFIEPVGTWPEDIVPENLQRTTVQLFTDFGRIGAMVIQDSTDQGWDVAITDSSAELGLASFLADGTNKQLMPQTVSYYVGA